MKNKNFFQFKNLKKQDNLIHGVFDKNPGNIDFRFGEKREVVENRMEIAKALNIKLKNLYEMEQVHGNNVRLLDYKIIRLLEDNVLEKTDGLITDQKNVFLMIKTADCFPLLFFDPIKKAVAAIHVGWRGAIEKIFLIALLKMISVFNSKAKDILVGIGPGIGPCCFKHKNLIQEKLPEWQGYISCLPVGKEEKNHWKSLNLSGFIKDQLVGAGIKKDNIEAAKICTCCSKDHFSHLRSLQTGELESRFAAIIGIR